MAEDRRRQKPDDEGRTTDESETLRTEDVSGISRRSSYGLTSVEMFETEQKQILPKKKINLTRRPKTPIERTRSIGSKQNRD